MSMQFVNNSVEYMICEIINESQFKQAHHSSLLSKMIKIYSEADFDTFYPPFLNCIKLCFVSDGASHNIDQSISFITKFLVRILDEENKDYADNSVIVISHIIRFLREFSQLRNPTIRKRTCQFIATLFGNIGHNASLDENFCNKITNMMLNRLKDKEATVRLWAVHALHRLQDPSDPSCPVTKAYYYHLEHDPNVDVRRAVLNKIGLSNSKTIENVIFRILDISEKVRRDAYVLLSKVPVLKFKITQRISLLSTGLKDCHVVIQDTVGKVLLPAWLKYLKNNYLLFLEALDVCMNPADICVSALAILFKNQPRIGIINQLNLLLDDNKMIPINQLTAESSLFWRCAITHILLTDNDNGNDNDKYGMTVIDDAHDSFTPSLTSLSDYMRQYYLPEEEPRKSKHWEILEQEFVITQLLELTKTILFNEDFGKQRLKILMIDMLHSKKPEPPTIRVIIELFFKLEDNVSNGFLNIMNSINDLLMPNGEEMCAEQNSPPNMPDRDIDTSLLKNQNPNVILKCLTIIQETMHLEYITSLTPTLRTLFQSFVFPAYSLSDPNISSMALELMGSFCLRDEELAKKHFILFCVEISNEQLCISALKVVFDLLVYYKPSVFKIKDLNKSEDEERSDLEQSDLEESADDSIEKPESRGSRTVASNIAGMLVDLLDDINHDVKVTAIKGISKLMLTGVVSSSKLLSRLILLWFHPTSRHSVEIQQYLGFFFPFYAKNCYDSQHVFEQAFLPTLTALFNAPIYSPLNVIDKNAVAKLLVSITNLKLLNKCNMSNNCHGGLAFIICNEMLEITEPSHHLVLLKALTHLDISGIDPGTLLILHTLTLQLEKKLCRYKDKTCISYLRKFKISLEQFEKRVEKQSSTNEEDKIGNYTENGVENYTENSVENYIENNVENCTENGVENYIENDSDNDSDCL